jgi:hypothetical protein
MTGATAGTNAQLAVTPGTNLYFRTRATGTNFLSDIQSLVVPTKPEPPQFTINYATGTTVESASDNILYSHYSNLSDPHYGTGAPIVLEPGNDLYLKQIATNSGFNSGVSHLVVPGNNFLGYSGQDTITGTKIVLYAILIDGSSAFGLDDLQITNGTAQNLRQGNVFDVYPAAKGPVTVVIPANTTKGNSFASNVVSVYYNKTTTGIHDLVNDDFSIYPNPSKGVIFIKSNQVEPYSVGIYSTDGNFIQSYGINSSGYQQINLQGLQKGVYFIKISTSQGVTIQKLILE